MFLNKYTRYIINIEKSTIEFFYWLNQLSTDEMPDIISPGRSQISPWREASPQILLITFSAHLQSPKL